MKILRLLFIIGFIMAVIGLGILAGYLSWNEFHSDIKRTRVFKNFFVYS